MYITPQETSFFRYSVLFIVPAPEVFFSRVRLDVSLSTAGRQIFGQSHERHGWTETGNRAWIVSGTQVTLFLCCVLKRTVLSSQYSFLSVYCATKQNFWRCQCCSCSTDLRTQQNVFNKKVHKPARCLQWSFRLIVKSIRCKSIFRFTVVSDLRNLMSRTKSKKKTTNGSFKIPHL